MATCKESGKGIKVVKGNTSNLMSHLKTKHSKIYSRSIVPSMYKEVRKEVESKLSDVLQSKNKMALTRHGAKYI